MRQTGILNNRWYFRLVNSAGYTLVLRFAVAAYLITLFSPFFSVFLGAELPSPLTLSDEFTLSIHRFLALAFFPKVMLSITSHFVRRRQGNPLTDQNKLIVEGLRIFAIEWGVYFGFLMLGLLFYLGPMIAPRFSMGGSLILALLVMTVILIPIIAMNLADEIESGQRSPPRWLKRILRVDTSFDGKDRY